MSLKRRIQRVKENAALAALIKDVAFCKAYIESMDKLFQVIAKAHPEWIAEAFPESATPTQSSTEPSNAP